MVVSPVVNRLKPPPVPETATLGFTPPWSFLNSSATAWVIGSTVLEPSISMAPLSPESPSAPSVEVEPPQAARPRDRTRTAVTATQPRYLTLDSNRMEAPPFAYVYSHTVYRLG